MKMAVVGDYMVTMYDKLYKQINIKCDIVSYK